MAQLTGTAGRSASHTPREFVAGVLLATAVIVTGIILALALGVELQLRDDVTAAPAAVSAPGAGSNRYDGRLDPIEADYIRRSHSGAFPAPRYVPAPAPEISLPPRGGLPRIQLVPS